MSEILNCPFCGGEAKVKHSIICGYNTALVICSKCGAGSPHNFEGASSAFSKDKRPKTMAEAEQNAIDTWNNRSVEQALELISEIANFEIKCFEDKAVEMDYFKDHKGELLYDFTNDRYILITSEDAIVGNIMDSVSIIKKMQVCSGNKGIDKQAHNITFLINKHQINSK